MKRKSGLRNINHPIPTLALFWMACLLACLLASCREKQDLEFEDVTERSGIRFRYTIGDHSYENILESSGSGISVWDYDGDGDQDLLLLNGTYLPGISGPDGVEFRHSADHLYRNNGDGTFREVGREAGIRDTLWSMAAAPVDLDADGDLDLYLLNFGPNVFYRNEGNGTFTDVTETLGLKGPDTLHGFPKWSVSALFLDEDQDGLLDLFCGNFLAFDPAYQTPGKPGMMPHPSEYKGQASLFYRQLKDGSFREETRPLGLFDPDAMCMGLSAVDADGDGQVEIVQANDHQANYLFDRQGDGTYREVGVPAGVAFNDEGAPAGSMHPSLGDVDGDGRIDILVSDLEHGALYRNLGNGLFEDITAASGLKHFFAGKGAWAVVFLDADNDGDLDLFSANGRAEVLEDQPALLLKNDGQGHFSDAGNTAGPYFTRNHSGRGAVCLDYDNDGRMDLLVSHVGVNAPPALLRNVSGARNHWLGIRLLKSNGAPAWPGSLLTLYAGGRKQVLLHQPGNSYLSFCDERVHAGLGQAVRVDSLRIRWPDGSSERFEIPDLDRYVSLKQGSGRP